VRNITRYFKNKQYIGVRDHEKDTWGNWVNVLTVRAIYGKPDIIYRDVVEEYTIERWDYWKQQVAKQAKEMNRRYLEEATMLTSYPIWMPKLKSCENCLLREGSWCLMQDEYGRNMKLSINGVCNAWESSK